MAKLDYLFGSIKTIIDRLTDKPKKITGYVSSFLPPATPKSRASQKKQEK